MKASSYPSTLSIYILISCWSHPWLSSDIYQDGKYVLKTVHGGSCQKWLAVRREKSTSKHSGYFSLFEFCFCTITTVVNLLSFCKARLEESCSPFPLALQCSYTTTDSTDFLWKSSSLLSRDFLPLSNFIFICFYYDSVPILLYLIIEFWYIKMLFSFSQEQDSSWLSLYPRGILLLRVD